MKEIYPSLPNPCYESQIPSQTKEDGEKVKDHDHLTTSTGFMVLCLTQIIATKMYNFTKGSCHQKLV